MSLDHRACVTRRHTPAALEPGYLDPPVTSCRARPVVRHESPESLLVDKDIPAVLLAYRAVADQCRKCAVYVLTAHSDHSGECRLRDLGCHGASGARRGAGIDELEQAKYKTFGERPGCKRGDHHRLPPRIGCEAFQCAVLQDRMLLHEGSQRATLESKDGGRQEGDHRNDANAFSGEVSGLAKSHTRPVQRMDHLVAIGVDDVALALA